MIAYLRCIRRAIEIGGQPRVLVTAMVLLGAAARLRQYFATTSYWHDEAYLLLNVFPKSFAELVGPLSHEQAAPPLFLCVLRACFLAAGPAELAMRLPALLASLAGLILMVPLARVVCGGIGRMWAVGCACVSSCLLHLTYQVKPYTTDVLVAEAVLLLSAVYLLPNASSRARSLSGLGLLAAALVGPWLSFPSAFMLAGACLALAIEAARVRSRAAWVYALVLPAMLAASCIVLWLVAARHHNTPYQQSFWTAEFMDLSSPLACVTWLVSKLVEAGNYGVQGIGVPVALLTVLGLASCWRRQRPLAIVLAAPVCLACVAAATRHYPLGNRLLAFLLPCLWLCAAQGIEFLSYRLRQRAAWVAPAIAVLLLTAGGVRTVLYWVVAKPSVEFRQAFDYVHRHWSDGDSLWVSQPEVYEAYFGHQQKLIHQKSGRQAMEQAARGGRVWMVCHPPVSQTPHWAAARNELASGGAVEVARRPFVHLDVMLFSPTTAAITDGRDAASRFAVH